MATAHDMYPGESPYHGSHHDFDHHDANGDSSNNKRRRITRACDRCHRSGVKCSAGPDINTCAPCATYQTPCTYNRPVKRRGPAPKQTSGQPHEAQATSTSRRRSQGPRTEPRCSSLPHTSDWTYEEVAPAHIIEGLIQEYYTCVYPLQMYYHYPRLLANVRAGYYKRHRAFFCSLMALCAITSARISDGGGNPIALGDSTSFPDELVSVPSEAYYKAALAAFPSDLNQALHFDYKRAKSSLALLCIQYGDIRGLQRHLGDYVTLCAMDGFHLEARWPAEIDAVETEERRRLYWSTYQLDIYASCTWGSTARHRESETTVLYPSEVLSDEDVTPSGIARKVSPLGRPSFVKGWNFVTDMYRILEHAVERLRMRRMGTEGEGGPAGTLFTRSAGPSDSDILGLVGKLYDDLPAELRVAEEVSPDHERNRLGFQATNIIITMQTLKMVVAGSGQASVSQRCAIVGDLLDAISNVPTAYIHLTGVPVLHHLAGIGHLLGSVISTPLSQWQYLQVRNALLSMADMLASLESVLSRTVGIAQKLQAHLERIDEHMTKAAKEREGRGVRHTMGVGIPHGHGVSPIGSDGELERDRERGRGRMIPSNANPSAPVDTTMSSEYRWDPSRDSRIEPDNNRNVSDILQGTSRQRSNVRRSATQTRSPPTSTAQLDLHALFANPIQQDASGSFLPPSMSTNQGITTTGGAGAGPGIQTGQLTPERWARALAASVPPSGQLQAGTDTSSYAIDPSLTNALSFDNIGPVFGGGVGASAQGLDGSMSGGVGNFMGMAAAAGASNGLVNSNGNGIAGGNGNGNGNGPITLPEDLRADWPFDMDEAFDFLGEWQNFGDGPGWQGTGGV